MKKLMIAAAIVCAVALSHAASIDWQFSEQALSKNSPVDISGYTAYLFKSADWTAALAEGITVDTFDSAVAKTASAFTKTSGGTAPNDWVKWDTGLLTWTSDSAASGNYNVVIFNGSQYAASDALAATSYATAQDAHDAATWKIAANKPALTADSFTAVPEPTSGLLLLLGVAGLALRRRRA